MEVIATKKTTFIERCFREADSNCSKGGFVKPANTTSRSHLATEQVLAGRTGRTPFINPETKGWRPYGFSIHSTWQADIATKYPLRVEAAKPS
jgi:hypothetical protein